MRRPRVLYGATSRAAATAAELVRGEFDVVPLSASTDSTTEGPAVVLVGRDGPDLRLDEMPLRIVALVDGDATGPWPSHWYSVLPAGVSAPILDRKSTRLNSSHLGISYAVFCLKKKKTNT